MKEKDIVSRTLPVHKEHELLLKLESAGLNDALAQKVIDSKGNNLAMEVVRMIQNGVFEPSLSQSQARAIMSKNFFGVEEAIKHFGVNPSKQQLAYLKNVPFTKEVLKSCKDTHILVAVFPMSILDIRGKVKRKLFYDAWYKEKEFAEDMGEVGWQLIRKVPIAGSTDKTWDEQQALLSKDEETPKGQVVVYTIIGHFLATGERLLENLCTRCSDQNYGSFIHIGFSIRKGLDVGGTTMTMADRKIGLLSVMKQ